jgi:hypothetical protein
MKMNYLHSILLIALCSMSFTTRAQGTSAETPKQIMLSIGGNPTSEYTVTWRTEKSSETVAQLVKATANPKFEGEAQEIKGTFVNDYGDDKKLVSHKVRF